MDKEKVFDIESRVLEKLSGKVYLLQDPEDRERVVSGVLSEVCGNLEKEVLKDEIKVLKSEEERKVFLESFLSYGEIEDLLCDPSVEDIIINSINHVFIHHAKRGLIKTEKRFKSLRELDIFIKKIFVFSGRTRTKQLENLELPNIQGRVNIAPSPLGPQITITKARGEPLSILDIIGRGTLSYDLAAQLWMYVEGLSVRPASLIICGAPGSGKTTLLNALFSFIPGNERIVVMEDTLELNTQLEESCSRLESTDELTLADLVKNTLRMRPDRLVVGEVRGEEARDLMTAVNIGKYCMGTLHASTSREAIIRMQNEPMNVPSTLVGLVDVLLIMKKFNFKDRVVRTVAELSETGGLEGEMVLLSQLWKYDYENRRMIELQPSTVYRDKLSRETGLSPKEIMDEVKARAKLLEILHAKGLTTLSEVTTFCRLYSANPEGALAKLGLEKKDLLSEDKKKK